MKVIIRGCIYYGDELVEIEDEVYAYKLINTKQDIGGRRRKIPDLVLRESQYEEATIEE